MSIQDFDLSNSGVLVAGASATWLGVWAWIHKVDDKVKELKTTTKWAIALLGPTLTVVVPALVSSFTSFGK